MNFGSPKFFAVVFLAFVLLHFGQQLSAEESEKKASMDDVVVTATRTEERAIDVPVKTEVITREKIEMSGVLDLGDLIAKYVPGHFKKYGGLLSPIGLRGFKTDDRVEWVRGYIQPERNYRVGISYEF